MFVWAMERFKWLLNKGLKGEKKLLKVREARFIKHIRAILQFHSYVTSTLWQSKFSNLFIQPLFEFCGPVDAHYCVKLVVRFWH